MKLDATIFQKTVNRAVSDLNPYKKWIKGEREWLNMFIIYGDMHQYRIVVSRPGQSKIITTLKYYDRFDRMFELEVESTLPTRSMFLKRMSDTLSIAIINKNEKRF